jgi:hypothetical protein
MYNKKGALHGRTPHILKLTSRHLSPTFFLPEKVKIKASI